MEPTSAFGKDNADDAKRKAKQPTFKAGNDPGDDPEPRWPVIVAVLCAGALHYALPDAIAVGPRWLLFSILAVLLVPTVLFHRAGNHRLNMILGHAIAGVITAFMIWSIALLLRSVTHKDAHSPSAQDLLQSAAFLWITNVLVFGLWYWRLDAGGPHVRDQKAGHASGSFLFPQMTLPQDVENATGAEDWAPHFIDYLFLAFNTSTALSPTDAPILSRWAKMLMMMQALISLTVIVLIAARAVNILPS